MPAPDPIDEANSVLRRGGLVAIPTETVYGLAGDARNVDAVRAIFRTKGRPADHPLIVHVADASGLDAFAIDVPDAARKLAEAFWPGPLTIVLWRATSVLDVVTGGLDTVALRVPNHPLTLELLRRFGGGLAAPSANRFGKVSPTTADHVRDDLGSDVDYVLDGGACDVGLESTIVDLTGDVPTILRRGAIDAAAIEAVLGVRVERVASGPSRAPGMLASHYAPRAKVRLVDEGELFARAEACARGGANVAVLVRSRTDSPLVQFELGLDPRDAGRALYAALRAADAAGVDELFVSLPAGEGVEAAIADRLRRAATD